MSSIGVTEIFVVLGVFAVVLYLTHKAAFNYGKSVGKNEKSE
jgi:hypothetical protein